MDGFAGHKAVFNFRIDLDYMLPAHVIKVLEISQKFNVKMSWFINGKSSSYYPEILRQIAKTQDVQNHGYVHKTYEDIEANYKNIIECDRMLKGCGIKAEGFSAPHGKWNPSMCTAVEKAGYLYSSEFRQFGKNLPFHPEIGGKKSRVLQIPIHPISEGDLFYRGYTTKEIKKYYSRIIDMSYQMRIPIFLYGHPAYGLGKYPEILSHIFSEVAKKDEVKYITLTDYAKYWIKNKPKARDSGKELNSALLKKRMNYSVYLKNYIDSLLLNARIKITKINYR